MGLFSRKQQPGGMIGIHGLSDWWLATFTDDERGQLETLYAEAPVPGTAGPRLASGTGWMTTQSASQLLGGLAYKAEKSAPDLVPTLLAKQEELALTSGDVLELHFAYSTAIKLWYTRREAQPGAFEAAVAVCERQIAIGPQAWAAFSLEAEGGVFQPPSHRGFQQLAIIREKQRDFTEALRLCREASSQGWRDGKGDWSNRIARLERRLSKTG